MAINKETGEYERAKDFVNWRSVKADRRISFPAVVSFKKDEISGKDAEFATLVFGFGEQNSLLYFGPGLPGEEVKVYKGSISESVSIQPTNQFGSIRDGFSGHSGCTINSIMSVFIDVNATPEHLSTSKIEEDYHMREVDWQPIESAPKDIPIQFFIPEESNEINPNIVSCYWEPQQDSWIVCFAGEKLSLHFSSKPTHWRFLPDPPKDKRLDNMIGDLRDYLKDKNPHAKS